MYGIKPKRFKIRIEKKIFLNQNIFSFVFVLFNVFLISLFNVMFNEFIRNIFREVNRKILLKIGQSGISNRIDQFLFNKELPGSNDENSLFIIFFL